MSWETVDPQLREIIARVCTAKEQEALKLKSAGHGLRAIARRLGIDRSAVRDRLDRAERKIRAEVAAMRGVQDA